VLVDADVSLQGTAASGSTLAIAGGGASGANDRLRFSGAVKPSTDATLIELRVQQSGADWRTVAFARTDAEGNYSFSHRFRYAGNVSVMAVAHVRHEHITGSPPLTYTITQAQNPALTIQATAPSPAPITTTAGVPVSSSTPATTINGIVLGGHDQSVVLLARPLGTSRFAPVASTRADATGAYTFTVDPTATTLYKVRFGSTRSTVVRVAAG
jgi:hypothetical protein